MRTARAEDKSQFAALERVCKVHGGLADEVSEQRGFYYTVTWTWVGFPPEEAPEAGNPNQVSSQGEWQWLWVS